MLRQQQLSKETATDAEEDETGLTKISLLVPHKDI
jgi:hypothetical protein